MSNNNGTGKGSKVRSGLDKKVFGENLDGIQKVVPKIKKCGSCQYFKGINVIGLTLCEEGVVFDLNGKNRDQSCDTWKWIHEPK